MDPIYSGWTEPAAQTALRALTMAWNAADGTAEMQTLILRRYDEYCLACDEQDHRDEMDYARYAGATL